MTWFITGGASYQGTNRLSLKFERGNIQQKDFGGEGDLAALLDELQDGKWEVIYHSKVKRAAGEGASCATKVLQIGENMELDS